MKTNFFSLIAKNIRSPIRFIKNFLLSIYNYYSIPKKISTEINLDLMVISTGGVATTSLINYLKLYKKVNDENDKDGYKHLSRFPFVDNNKLKIIYIYGEYEKIYNSLKRRNIFQEQMVKLGCPFCYLLRGRLERFFFKICIDKQIKSFKDKDNVFVLEFDEIWEKKEQLKKFLEIENNNFIENFPLKI